MKIQDYTKKIKLNHKKCRNGNYADINKDHFRLQDINWKRKILDIQESKVKSSLNSDRWEHLKKSNNPKDKKKLSKINKILRS